MRAVVIHNPTSGMRQDHSPLNQAVVVLRERGWELVLNETQNTDDATRYARAAADKSFDAAFAVGGDGTLNEVLNGLLGSNTALGVLPFGTSNVWAIEMGIPLDNPARAAQMQADASARTIDVGVAQGRGFGPRAFILSCGAGFDAAVVREVEAQRDLKRQWGKLFFVAVGVLRALKYRGRNVTVTVDGKKHRRRVILALTSNTQLYGAVVRIPPDARIDDGLLDVTLLQGDNVFNTAWHFIRLGSGIYNAQSDIDHLMGREIEISGSSLPVHVDAEPVGSTPLQIHVKPRALRVLVPDTANAGLFSPQ